MKDRDTATDAQRLHLLAWAAVAGVLGGVVGAGLGGSPALAVVGVALGAGGVFGLAEALSRSAATAAGIFLAPSGRTTPGSPEFSLADSLAARGLLSEAAAEYERLCSARPGDPHPCVRLARLNRDRLHDQAAAATWFTAARRRATDPAFEHLIVNELVELYVRHMNEPVRALPELARYAHRHAGTLHGRRAAAELARIRQEQFTSDP